MRRMVAITATALAIVAAVVLTQVTASAGGGIGARATAAMLPPTTPAPVDVCQPGDFGSFILLGDGERVVSERDVPVCMGGTVTVTYQGSRAAGCAAHGLCGYAGVERINPQVGDLSVLVLSRHGQLSTAATFSVDESTIETTVTRTVAGRLRGTCHDGPGEGGFSALPGGLGPTPVRDGELTFGLGRVGVDSWPGSCAGPVSSVVPPAPPFTLALSQAKRPGATTTVEAQRSFSGGGWAGTLNEHVTLVTAGVSPSPGTVPQPAQQKSMRIVTARYRVTLGAASVDVTYSHPRAGCVRLDACGLQGSQRLRFSRSRPATLELSAVGPANRPERDFLTALGIAQGGDPHGISVGGSGSLPGGGTIAVATHQPASRCHASAPLTGGELDLALGQHPTVSLELGSPLGANGLRTSCPGPALGYGFRTVASAPLAPTELQGRTLSLRLTTPGTLTAEGYRVQVAPDLRLVASRESITDTRLRFVEAQRRVGAEGRTWLVPGAPGPAAVTRR